MRSLKVGDGSPLRSLAPALERRANGALNLFHIGAAFAVQYAIGLFVQPTVGEGGKP
jgi:hypothetical protein